MKREWPPHRSFRVSDRIVPPSLPPFFSSCSDRTRARYPGLPPPLPLPLPLLPLPSTIASPHRLYGHHRGPLLSRPKVSRRFTALPFPPYVLHTRDDSTPSRRIPTALLRPPSLSDSVARLPPPSEISPSRAAHNSTRALFLPPSRSACKWFERWRAR